MKPSRKACIITLALAAWPYLLEAQAQWPDPSLEALLSGGDTVRRGFTQGEFPHFIPDSDSGKALREDFKKTSPNISAEILGRFDYPPRLAALDPKARLSLVYAMAKAFSRLKGAQYYSETWKKRKTLYSESSLVAGPEYDKALPDPGPGTPPPNESLFVRQKDSSFGYLVLQVDYALEPFGFSMSIRNLRPVYLGPIKAIESECLRTGLILIEKGGCLYVYGLSYAKTKALPLGESSVLRSVQHRLDAIMEWFGASLNGA